MYIKWSNTEMAFVNVKSENTVRRNDHSLNYNIEN